MMAKDHKAGHRGRLSVRFVKAGRQAFAGHDILVMLLKEHLMGVVKPTVKNEHHTRKEIIDKRLHAAGWIVADLAQVIEVFNIEVGLAEGYS